jgi:hypothetical protein
MNQPKLLLFVVLIFAGLAPLLAQPAAPEARSRVIPRVDFVATGGTISNRDGG